MPIRNSLLVEPQGDFNRTNHYDGSAIVPSPLPGSFAIMMLVARPSVVITPFSVQKAFSLLRDRRMTNKEGKKPSEWAVGLHEVDEFSDG